MQPTKRHPRGPCVFAVLLLLCSVAPLHAQTAQPGNLQPSTFNLQPTPTPNRVLELDGTNSFVELPPNIFNELTEATVEFWARWDRLDGPGWKRPFSYGGGPQHDFSVATRGGGLWFVICDAQAGLQDLFVPDVLWAKEWVHVAAVSGRGGMRLYLNGMLVGNNSYPGSFAATKDGGLNRIGKTVVPTDNDRDPPFKGGLDEVRVWSVAHTEAQIRETMFQRLTGQEPGLAGLWNFDNVENGVVKDATSGAHHGRLTGNAKIVEAQLPGSSQLNLPAILLGKINDSLGNPVANATIRVFHQEQETATTQSHPDGTYSLVLRPEQAEETFDLRTDAGDLGAWMSGVTCSGGERKEVNVTLANAVSIAGKVTAFDGSPIPDVIVQAVRADAPPREAGRLASPGLAATTLTTTTNTAQSYRFLNLRPGEYKVRIHVPQGQLEYPPGRGLARATGPNRGRRFPDRAVPQRPVAPLLHRQRIAE